MPLTYTLPGSVIDSAVLTAAIISGPAHGVLSVNADGSYTYTPDANYFGDASFTYRLNDGQPDSNLATAFITITPVNDVPVAADIQTVTGEDYAVVIDALGQARTLTA